MGVLFPDAMPEFLWELRAAIISTRVYQRLRDSNGNIVRSFTRSRTRNSRRRLFNTDHKLGLHNNATQEHYNQVIHEVPAQTESLIYDALPHDYSIRLVRVHAAENIDDPLKLHLESCRLSSSQAFMALSYTWRPDFPRHVVACSDRCLTIGHSLWSALRHIRKDTEDTLCWIDAIAINQQDLVERTQQVQMMRQIYQAAHETIIWLGIPSLNGDSAATFALLQKMANLGDEEEEQFRYFPDTLNDIPTRGLPESSEPIWSDLDELFWKHWFTRAWIIQELAVSKKPIVRFGSHSIDWHVFASAADFIMRHTLTRLTGVDPTRTVLLERYRLAFAEKAHLSTLELLCRARHSYASDERDKVFSILGLTSDTVGIIPDYQLPADVTYIETAKKLLLADQSLDLLTACEDSALRTGLGLVLPSWVPNWEIDPWSTPFLLLESWNRWSPIMESYSAAELSYFPSDNSNAFCVSGIIYDTVDHVAETFLDEVFQMPGSVQAAELWSLRNSKVRKALVEQAIQFYQEQRYRQWEKIARKTAKKIDPPLNEDNLLDSFARVLTADQTLHVSFTNNPDNVGLVLRPKLYYDAWRTLMQHMYHHSGEPVPPGTLSFEEIQRAVLFADAHQRASYGRRFITTRSKHFMGLAHSSVRQGDSVVLLRGGRTPYILRKVKSEGTVQQWTMIGEAYMHGLMLRNDHSEELKREVKDAVAMLPEQTFKIG